MGCILFMLSAVCLFRIQNIFQNKYGSFHLLFKTVYWGYSTNTNTLLLSIPGT
jgi:hypothetical protein